MQLPSHHGAGDAKHYHFLLRVVGLHRGTASAEACVRNPHLAMSRAVNSQAAEPTRQSAKGAFADHQPLAHATSGDSSCTGQLFLMQ